MGNLNSKPKGKEADASRMRLIYDKGDRRVYQFAVDDATLRDPFVTIDYLIAEGWSTVKTNDAYLVTEGIKADLWMAMRAAHLEGQTRLLWLVDRGEPRGVWGRRIAEADFVNESFQSDAVDSTVT